MRVKTGPDVDPLSLCGKGPEVGGHAVVTLVSLVPYGQTDPIGHQGKEPARVAVAVVIGAEVLEIHGRSSEEIRSGQSCR